MGFVVKQDCVLGHSLPWRVFSSTRHLTNMVNARGEEKKTKYTDRLRRKEVKCKA